MSRAKVITLYKALLHMGREYPAGYSFFRERCHKVFMKNRDIKDPQEIEKLLKHGEYIINELKALYSLKKYRTLKRRYYQDNEDPDKLLLQLAKKTEPTAESKKK